VHVYRARGAIAPFLLTSLPRNYHGTWAWARTWTHGPADWDTTMSLFLSPNSEPDYTRLPERAFPDADSRAEGIRVTEEWRRASGGRRAMNSGAAYQPVDEFMAKIAQHRRSESVFKYDVLPAVVRAWNLWWKAPGVGLVSPDRAKNLAPANWGSMFRDGMKQGVLRLGRSSVSALIYALYYCVLAYFAWISIRGLQTRQWIPIAIVAGVVAYTALAAYLGGVEFRRNLPFYPLMFICACFVAWRTERTRGVLPIGNH
jgi:hypothetical protein